jgi:hypothetical protein
MQTLSFLVIDSVSTHRAEYFADVELFGHKRANPRLLNPTSLDRHPKACRSQ